LFQPLRLALTGRDVDAAEALRIGLVSEVIPDPAAVHGAPEQISCAFTDAFTRSLLHHAESDPRIVAITAAMPGPTGLLPFQARFPERFVDVGIAEHGQRPARFALALRAIRIAVSRSRLRLRAVGRDHDSNRALLRNVLRNEPAAADHLVVGMGSEHQKSFAEESSGIVRNGVRFDEHLGLDYMCRCRACLIWQMMEAAQA